MEHESISNVLVITTIAIIIFTSPYVANIVRLPTTLVEILLGFGASIFNLIDPKNHTFELIAEVGFFYLMFLAGTEVNLKLLLKLEKDIFIKGSIYLFCLYLFSLIFVKILNFSPIFIFMFSIISVGLIMSLFKEYGKDEKWLNLAMNIGVLGELLSIMLLTIVSSMLMNGFGKAFFNSIGLFFAFMLALFVLYKIIKSLFWWYPELKNFIIPSKGDKDEKDIRTSMALFFLMVALMSVLNIEIAFGAFIAGIFIVTFFDNKKELPHKLETFGFGFLIPIFFVHIGSTFELRFLFIEKLVIQALWISFAMIVVRFLASTVFYKILSLKEQVLFAFSHSMPLTLLLAVATLALESKAIKDFDYYSLVLASVLEVIISMIAIKLIKHQFSDVSNESGTAS